MTLRRATRDDVATIAAWHPMEPAGVLEWWDDDEVLPWVLEVDGTPSAYGELWLDPEEDEVELARLIVPEPLRGRGHGGLLTRLLVAEAASTGLATTMLRTTDDNHVAIACYLANGFTRLPAEEERAWNQGQRRAWVWMVLASPQG
ncbi:GNAT family N-acetyltransferase [Nocardioides sp. 1609]|uniref:GNAT family N-acetyltransferase n=1 Tax=Nocardioides sp. 1609 TaxID=2508327 RepID=UPI00106FDEEF|nr:GNAT family N-acetyltransferase [Nocardioides sp. 1609]